MIRQITNDAQEERKKENRLDNSKNFNYQVLNIL